MAVVLARTYTEERLLPRRNAGAPPVLITRRLTEREGTVVRQQTQAGHPCGMGHFQEWPAPTLRPLVSSGRRVP